ncbi:MAG: ATP-binding protein [Gemmatimonadales bacterium]|nr:ATP-binding protein [Gemmatimonadales bacterium]
MPTDLTLLQISLLSQSVEALVVTVLVGALYWRVRPRPFFRWWTLGWGAYAVYVVAGAISIAIGPALSPLKLGLLFLTASSGLLNIGGVYAGLADLDGTPIRPPRLSLGAALGIAVVAGLLLVPWSNMLDLGPSARVAVRTLPRQALGVVVFALAARLLLRQPEARHGWAFRLLGGACIGWALSLGAYAYNSVDVLSGRTLPVHLPQLLQMSLTVSDLVLLTGTAIGLVLLVVEEHVAARQRHERTSEALRTLVDASPTAIVALDAAGRVQLWNPAAERLFARPAASMLGEPLPAELPGTAPEVRAAWLRALAGDAVQVPAFAVHAADGQERAASLVAAPVHDGAGAGGGLIALFADTTAFRRLEEQFRHAQKMEAVGRLAGGIAHDFNNLLTAILGAVHMLREELPADAREQEEVAQIRLSAERAADLTTQLLAFSRRQAPAAQALDVNAALLGLERLLRRLLGPEVALEMALDPGAPVVHMDRGQLEQVLTNLAVNARDAMPGGGQLALATGTVTLDGTSPGVLAPPAAGRYVRITVRDSGIGMSRGVLARVFEPFFTTKPLGRGTGLGLATVYGIVEQAGGQIHVDSSPGQGSCFTIDLPASDAVPAPAPALAERVAPVRDATGTVLLIEDEAVIRGLVRKALTARGYRVLEARGGVEAEELARVVEGPIDLLIADVGLPGTGGHEIAERLQRARPALQVLYISGFPVDELRARGIPEDAVVLAKPFAPRDLVARVGEMLGG